MPSCVSTCCGDFHYVSTREALRPLEEPRQIEPPPESPYRRLLGVLFIVGGAVTIYFLPTRLQVARLVDAKRALRLAIVLDATKAVFLAGGAFARYGRAPEPLVLHPAPCRGRGAHAYAARAARRGASA